MTDTLAIDRPADGVLRITLAREAMRNALDRATLGRLRDAIVDEDAARCIVITGAGSRAFCAGYDVRELATLSPEEQVRDYIERDMWLGDIAACAIPTIAALNGPAHGGGVMLAAVCDLRVGSPASAISITAARYNGCTATWSLPPLVGHGVAKEWLMTSRVVTGEEAHARGFLNTLVAADAVAGATLALAMTIAGHPPGGVRAIKRLVDSHVGRSRDDARRAETATMVGELAPRPVGEPPAMLSAVIADGERRPPVPVAPDSLAAILYTSGSTGLPKGTMQTHATIAAFLLGYILPLQLTSADRTLIVAPLAFTGGCLSLLIPMLAIGACAVIEPTLEPDRVLRLIEDERISFMTMVPAIWERLPQLGRWRDADLSSLRVAMTGGAPVSTALLEAFRAKGVGIRQVYGCTELGAMGCTPPLDIAMARPETRHLLGPLKTPREILLSPDPLPKTVTNKVARHELPALYDTLSAKPDTAKV